MNVPSLTEADLDFQSVSLDGLYRVSTRAYQGLIEHGLIARDQVALVDGLLMNVNGGETTDGSETDLIDRLYRIPLDLYHGMIEHGLLTEHDHVVLLDGLLVKKMGRKPPHVKATIKVFRLCSAIVPAGWEVRKEDPITLPGATAGRDSEPEPDVFIVRGDLDDFDDHHPGPADLALVVEVAESSLRGDRAGLARYAWSKIPVAWIVNLIDETVEVYTRPTGPSELAKYEETQVYQKGDRLPVVVDGREVGRVAVSDLLP